MKPALTQLLIALAVLALSLGGYIWWYTYVTSESLAVASLVQEIETKAETAKRTTAIETTLKKLATSQDEVHDYFLSEQNIVTFLDDLEASGENSSARVQVTSVGAPAGKIGDQALPVALTIGGNFDSVLRTLGVIENMPYAVAVASLSFNKTTDGWSAVVGLMVGSAIAAASTPPARAPTGTSPSAGPKPSGAQPL